MNKNRLFLTATAFLCALLFVTHSALALEVISTKRVKIQKGQTLYNLSRTHNISTQDIIRANQLKKPYTLYPGQVLYIPSRSIKTPIRTTSFQPKPVKKRKRTLVTVQKGTTLYAIARQNNISVRDIIRINKLQPPYGLKIGQKLRIPQTRFYTVKKKDTLYSISRFFDVPMDRIVASNNMLPPYLLSKGQKLVIPTESVPEKMVKRKPKWAKKTLPVPKNKRLRFAWPLKGKLLKKFGKPKLGQKHEGINIAATKGQIVKASEDGVVVYTGNALKQYGNLILIKHAHNYITAYAHLDQYHAKRGSKVKKGQKIATIGQTGNVDAPQLHFQIRKNNKVINPMRRLK